jgi:hypothetical protein
MARWLDGTSVAALLLLTALAGPARATGPGGWESLGDTPAPSLDAVVYALDAETLAGRLKRSRLAALKRLGHVRVRVRVVPQAPDGSRSTVTKLGTLRAPK